MGDGDAEAIHILREQLDLLGGTSTSAALAVKAKWGTNQLKDLGSVRKFVLKYPDVFTMDGNTVSLVNPTSKSAQPPPEADTALHPAPPAPQPIKATPSATPPACGATTARPSPSTMSSVPQSGGKATPSTPPVVTTPSQHEDSGVGAPSVVAGEAFSPKATSKGIPTPRPMQAVPKPMQSSPKAKAPQASPAPKKRTFSDTEGISKMDETEPAPSKARTGPPLSTFVQAPKAPSKFAGAGPAAVADSLPKARGGDIPTQASPASPSAAPKMGLKGGANALKAPPKGGLAPPQHTPLRRSWGEGVYSPEAPAEAEDDQLGEPEAKVQRIAEPGLGAVPKSKAVGPPNVGGKGQTIPNIGSKAGASRVVPLGSNENDGDEELEDGEQGHVKNSKGLSKDSSAKGKGEKSLNSAEGNGDDSKGNSCKGALGKTFRAEKGGGTTTKGVGTYHGDGGAEQIGDDAVAAPMVPASKHGTPAPKVLASVKALALKKAPTLAPKRAPILAPKHGTPGSTSSWGREGAMVESMENDSGDQSWSEPTPPQGKLVPPPQKASMMQKVVAPKKPAWQEDRLQDNELPGFISDCKLRGVELEIQSLARRLTPTDHHKRAGQRCLALLRSAVAAQWGSRKGAPQPLVEVCGASAQGTDLDGSDLDVLLRLDASLTPEEREKGMSQLKEQLQKPPTSNLVVVSDGLQLFPHSSAPMTVKMTAPGIGGKQHRIMAHVMLGDLHDNTLCERPKSIDDVARLLCDTTEQARDVVRLVKLWATNHGFTGLCEGFMNGLAWTFLALFFLQKQQLVPPFASLASGNAHPVTGKTPLLKLMRGFFEFLSSRASNEMRGLSVNKASEFQVHATPEDHVIPPLYVEDPAEIHATGQQRNLAMGLGEQQWVRITDEAKKAFDRLSARPQRWFHWAEICDPRVVPADKIQKLQPLAALLGDATTVPSPSPPTEAVTVPPADSLSQTAPTEATRPGGESSPGGYVLRPYGQGPSAKSVGQGCKGGVIPASSGEGDAAAGAKGDVVSIAGNGCVVSGKARQGQDAFVVASPGAKDGGKGGKEHMFSSKAPAFGGKNQKGGSEASLVGGKDGSAKDVFSSIDGALCGKDGSFGGKDGTPSKGISGKEVGKGCSKDGAKEQGKDGFKDGGKMGGKEQSSDGGKNSGKDFGADGAKDGFKSFGKPVNHAGKDGGKTWGKDGKNNFISDGETDPGKDIGKDTLTGASKGGKESSSFGGGKSIGKSTAVGGKSVPTDITMGAAVPF
eukprot:TRINITY_DN61307_c0_g1_i1.p1 TRINITY_DN61307_c0_g1~~TRINITY_DN61307_c0_g1_i1.p1  ORF type:complete len:1254 (+),score=261.92 TRINITY_DN61307_c0_g1_i1:61-3822(+)